MTFRSSKWEDDCRASACGYGKDCASALRGSCARVLRNPFRAETARSAHPRSVSSGARVFVILITVDAKRFRFADVLFQFETHGLPDGSVSTFGAKCFRFAEVLFLPQAFERPDGNIITVGDKRPILLPQCPRFPAACRMSYPTSQPGATHPLCVATVRLLCRGNKCIASVAA